MTMPPMHRVSMIPGAFGEVFKVKEEKDTSREDSLAEMAHPNYAESHRFSVNSEYSRMSTEDIR